MDNHRPFQLLPPVPGFEICPIKPTTQDEHWQYQWCRRWLTYRRCSSASWRSKRGHREGGTEICSRSEMEGAGDSFDPSQVRTFSCLLHKSIILFLPSNMKIVFPGWVFYHCTSYSELKQYMQLDALCIPGCSRSNNCCGSVANNCPGNWRSGGI